MRKRKPLAALPASEAPEDRDQPEVIVDFLFDHGLFHVAVENVSDAPAYLVSVTFDKKFRGLGGATEVSSLPLFRRVAFLAPRKRIETFLDTSSAYFQRREPTRLTAMISFRDARQRPYERRITHDLSIYKDVTYLLKPAEMNSPVISSPPAARITPVTGEQRYGSPQR
jgi:hypothetical protein